MADKNHSSAMKNAEASGRMEGLKVTSGLHEQCQRVLDGELTTTDALMQPLSEREKQNLRNALASTRMEGFEVTEQTVEACVKLLSGKATIEQIVSDILSR